MPVNRGLRTANQAKKAEFYTQLSVIEEELKHYKSYFKNKIVYCNCDDPRASNFFHYFSYNFEKLGLKKLITSCYKNQNRDLFSQNKSEKAVYLEYEGDKNENKVPDAEEIGVKNLLSDGDFRNEECIKILKKSDVVVTNPPFFLFREYVSQLIKYKKKFLIIGNMNAISYREIFKLLKENKIWLGASIKSGDREFGVPKDYPLKASGFRTDRHGNKYIRVKGVRWFTNLEISKRYENLELYNKYSPKKYQKFDNYRAINVDKTIDIPINYKGLMGVPISFMDKYNPKQFEIVDGIGRYSMLHGPTKATRGKYLTEIKGKKIYARIIIRHKKL